MKRVVLHVGIPKTGTTYLQNTLARNRETLHRAGIAYHQMSTSLSACHWWFALSFFSNIEEYSPAKNDIARGVSKKELLRRGKKSVSCVASEISNNDVLIISAEQFFFLPWEVLKNMRQFFLDHNSVHVEVLIYVRDPLDLSFSIINQEVKMGFKSLHSLVTNMPYFQLKKEIQKFEAIFGQENIHIRNYSQIISNDLNLIDDFLYICEPHFLTDHLVFESSKNASLCYEALVVLDEFNDLFPGFAPHSVERDLIIRALSFIRGSRLSTSNSAQQYLLTRLADDFEYLKEAYGISFDQQIENSDFQEDQSIQEGLLRSFAPVLHSLVINSNKLESSTD